MADTFVPVTFVADELLTSTKMNQLSANQAAFHDGTGLGDGSILTRHLNARAVTPAKVNDFDWFRMIPSTCYSSVIAGTWSTVVGNYSNGNPLELRVDSVAQNDEIQFKVVLAAGTYKVALYCDKDINRGIYTISVDGVSVGTFDGYSASRVSTVYAVINAGVTVAANKLVAINVKMASKNPSSSGYIGAFSRIDVIRMV